MQQCPPLAHRPPPFRPSALPPFRPRLRSCHPPFLKTPPPLPAPLLPCSPAPLPPPSPRNSAAPRRWIFLPGRIHSPTPSSTSCPFLPRLSLPGPRTVPWRTAFGGGIRADGGSGGHATCSVSWCPECERGCMCLSLSGRGRGREERLRGAGACGVRRAACGVGGELGAGGQGRGQGHGHGRQTGRWRMRIDSHLSRRDGREARGGIGESEEWEESRNGKLCD
jgi:hypothetical protein